MIRKHATLVLLAPLIFFFCACDKGKELKLKIEIDPDSDLRGYRSYAVMPLPTELPGLDPEITLTFGRIAHEVLNAELAAKGYTPSDLKNADFTVNVRGKIVPQIDVNEYGYGHYGPRKWWRKYPHGNVTEHDYKEGTIIIEIYDGSSKKMVWVGWVKGRKKAGNPGTEDFRAIIQRIIQPYPGGE